MNLIRLALATLLFALVSQVQAGPAIFIKYESVPGDSPPQHQAHNPWKDIQKLVPTTVRAGKILIGLTRGGKRVAIQNDGRYLTNNGKMIIIVNGRVNRVESRHAFVKPGRKVGLNPQPEPPSKKPVAPGGARGFNPQPEPPPITGHKFVKPGQLKGFNPQPEPPPAPASKAIH